MRAKTKEDVRSLERRFVVEAKAMMAALGIMERRAIRQGDEAKTIMVRRLEDAVRRIATRGYSHRYFSLGLEPTVGEANDQYAKLKGAFATMTSLLEPTLFSEQYYAIRDGLYIADEEGVNYDLDGAMGIQTRLCFREELRTRAEQDAFEAKERMATINLAALTLNVRPPRI